jgi:hypothetical protein
MCLPSATRCMSCGSLVMTSCSAGLLALRPSGILRPSRPQRQHRDRTLTGPALIRDRDGKFPAVFDAVLKDAGAEIVLGGSRCRE